MRSTGALLCAVAMTILGTSFAVSRLLLGYPTLAGQAMRYTLAAGLAWATGALGGEVCFSLLAAPLLPALGPVRVSAWACALAVPQLALACALTGEWRRMRVPTAAESAALLYVAVVLTVLAFLCW